MKTFKSILMLGFFATLVVACNPKEAPQDGDHLKAMQEELFADLTDTSVLDAATGGTIIGSQGSQFIFQPNSFQDGNGNLITGNVTIEYAEVYKRSDMVLMNKPTTGQMANGDKTYLLTGGEFYVKVSQNSCNCEVVISTPFEIRSAPDTDFSNFDTNLIGFRGEMQNDELVWLQMEGNTAAGINFVPVGVRDGGNGFYYSIFTSENGWTNLDRFSADPRPKTTLEVTVPQGYDDQNSTIYISIDGDDHGIAPLDTYANGIFSEHYGQLPIGLEAHLIFFTVDDNDVIRYQIKPITVTVGQQEAIDNLAVISQTDFQTAIDALP